MASFALPAQEPPAATANHPPQQAGGHAQHRSGPPKLLLHNAEGATATLWLPDLSQRPIAIDNHSIELPRTGMDSYHALVVTQDWGHRKESLIRYPYLRGKPSGHSPAELTAAVKSDLEIVPDPLPREHQKYLSGKPYRFLVRFRGEPLANAPLRLEGANGTTLFNASGPDGRVVLQLPEDFPDIVPGERDEREAGFSIHTAHTRDGVSHATQLQAAYEVNPEHWRSRWLGVLFIGLGLVAGGLLSRLGRAPAVRP